MLISKQRLIHAVVYEAILWVLVSYGLSYFLTLPFEESGLLIFAMCVISVVWNMLFNILYEKAEKKYKFKRTVFYRILHAIGFEGGLMIITTPMFAYYLGVSFIDAFLLDFSLVNCILVYTFIYQWCYDKIMMRKSVA